MASLLDVDLSDGPPALEASDAEVAELRELIAGLRQDGMHGAAVEAECIASAHRHSDENKPITRNALLLALRVVARARGAR